MAAVIIAAMITAILLGRNYYYNKKHSLHTDTFHTEQGWGYNIRFGDKIVVHQPMVPGKVGFHGFDTESAADSAAQAELVRIRARQWP